MGLPADTKLALPPHGPPTIKNFLIGKWVTSFDALYVNDEPYPIDPTAVLACWVFNSDGSFHAGKRDNRGRRDPLSAEEIEGVYTIGWHATLGIGEGTMTFVFPADPFPARYFVYVNLIMRDADTFNWLMAGGFYPDDQPPAPERAPIAQGVAHRIKIELH